jgi:hypothetical protein
MWFSEAGENRCVAADEVGPGYRVSTIFIGDGHTLFETAIITDTVTGDKYNRVRKYTTWDDAERGHAETAQACREQYKAAAKS